LLELFKTDEMEALVLETVVKRAMHLEGAQDEKTRPRCAFTLGVCVHPARRMHYAYHSAHCATQYNGNPSGARQHTDGASNACANGNSDLYAKRVIESSQHRFHPH
jgi:hypothetical protein